MKVSKIVSNRISELIVLIDGMTIVLDDARDVHHYRNIKRRLDSLNDLLDFNKYILSYLSGNQSRYKQ